jgi:S1-C subfamily serine protease
MDLNYVKKYWLSTLMLRFVIWLNDAMTSGIVSGIGRSIPISVGGFSIPNAIQTDARVNPGDSGGPLLIVTIA